ncbi:MAG: cyclic nucleotide-binding domain-containing protein [Rhodothermales bacterium]
MGITPKTDPSATFLAEQKLFEDRWASNNAEQGVLDFSGRLSVRELKRYDLFENYQDKVLEKIIPDVSVATWKPGTVLFEEGSFLDLAFYIVDGQVDIFIQSQDEAPQPSFDETRLATSTAYVAGSSGDAYTQRAKQAGRGGDVTFLASMDFDLPHGERVTLRKGDFFGEIGALNGWPQSATARTVTACTVVQIRTPALRRLRQVSKAFRERLDAIYRARTLLAQLKTTPLLRGCESHVIEALKDRVELVSCEPDETVCTAGDAADALYLVRSGFLRITQPPVGGDAAPMSSEEIRTSGEEVTLTYLSKGMTFGEAELLLEGTDRWLFSVTSVGYSELVRIRREDFDAVLRQHPDVQARLWESTVARIKETGYARQDATRSHLVDFSLNKGLVQGSSILVMDLSVCTRCDDCVRGCASTHGGRPRFVREGEKYDNLLVARSCYHCEDPVCMIGCPTGAIRRAGTGLVVEIDDDLCIGCGNCAEKCPYDAIIMHDTGENWPETAPAPRGGRPRQVASKCDLCHTSKHGPACVSSCPHGCAYRVGTVDEFQQLLEQTQPVT